jgi:hypothetical protein
MTGQEQDCAWGNGMDMGTDMKTRLNKILNNVLSTYIRDSSGAIITLCRFDLRLLVDFFVPLHQRSAFYLMLFEDT